ncbi:uncharacterized protein LOC126820420 isoform X3 [Patella vulgata]|uniref:uncharacterized protein LOC126820420 isoform X3 n=1 Tax=Patella vulgata TaxID=6465 RepID=UPI00217F9E8B|nr:uncharacterized protein LOC126820420 isoform X3 [Patella vulgata]
MQDERRPSHCDHSLVVSGDQEISESSQLANENPDAQEQDVGTIHSKDDFRDDKNVSSLPSTESVGPQPQTHDNTSINMQDERRTPHCCHSLVVSGAQEISESSQLPNENPDAQDQDIETVGSRDIILDNGELNVQYREEEIQELRENIMYGSKPTSVFSILCFVTVLVTVYILYKSVVKYIAEKEDSGVRVKPFNGSDVRVEDFTVAEKEVLHHHGSGVPVTPFIRDGSDVPVEDFTGSDVREEDFTGDGFDVRGNGFDICVKPVTGNEPVRLVIIGKTGSGKSSLANILLGKKGRFKCGAFGSSVTTTTEADEGYCKDSAVKVVDTPGFFDTDVNEDDNNREIIRCLMLSEPGPHAFIYVISIASRFTQEDAETFERVKVILGDSVTNYMVIVFTNKDRLDEEGITKEDYIKKAPSGLKRILKEIRKKPIFINSKSVNIESELDSLSTFIKGVNIDSYYTDVKYRSGIEILKRLPEVERKYKMAYTQWINKRVDIVNHFSEMESYLNAMVKNVRISKIAGCLGGMVGSTMMVAGLLCAQFTFSTSALLTVAGTGIGIASGVAGGGAALADAVITAQHTKEADTLFKSDRELWEKFDDAEIIFYQILSELFNIIEIRGVIQNVLKQSIIRSNNKTFEEEVKKGLGEARNYLLQFLNVESKYLVPAEIDTGHADDVSLGIANAFPINEDQLHELKEIVKQDMEDYYKDRDILYIFVDEIAKFRDPRLKN